MVVKFAVQKLDLNSRGISVLSVSRLQNSDWFSFLTGKKIHKNKQQRHKQTTNKQTFSKQTTHPHNKISKQIGSTKLLACPVIHMRSPSFLFDTQYLTANWVSVKQTLFYFPLCTSHLMSAVRLANHWSLNYEKQLRHDGNENRIVFVEWCSR